MRKVAQVSRAGTSTSMKMKKNTRMRSPVELSMVAVKRPTGFEDKRGVRPVGRARTIRLSQRHLGVPSVRGIIGSGHAQMISRRRAGSMLGGTLSYVVASWIGMICRFVRVSAICARTTQRLSRSKQIGRGHRTCLIVLLLPRERQPPLKRLPEEGPCSGAVVELEDEDVLEVLE